MNAPNLGPKGNSLGSVSFEIIAIGHSLEITNLMRKFGGILEEHSRLIIVEFQFSPNFLQIAFNFALLCISFGLASLYKDVQFFYVILYYVCIWTGSEHT